MAEFKEEVKKDVEAAKQDAQEVKEKVSEFAEDAKAAADKAGATVKDAADKAVDAVKEEAAEVKQEAKVITTEVKEEAQEVVQEAKAAVSGEQLESANTVGGAGYRAPEDTKNSKAVASLILGIVSIICVFFGYGMIVGLILGIVGTVLGAKARKESQTGMATAGFVCSIIGTVLNAAGLVCAIACIGSLAGMGSVLESME